MNKRQIVASLNKIAYELDNSGLYNEATTLTTIMKKIAFDMNMGFLESEEDFGDEYTKAVRDAREAVQRYVSFLDQNITNPEMLQNLIENPKAINIISDKSGYKIVDFKNPSSSYKDYMENEINSPETHSVLNKIVGLFLHLILKLNDSNNDEDYCNFVLNGLETFMNVNNRQSKISFLNREEQYGRGKLDMETNYLMDQLYNLYWACKKERK